MPTYEEYFKKRGATLAGPDPYADILQRVDTLIAKGDGQSPVRNPDPAVPGTTSAPIQETPAPQEPPPERTPSPSLEGQPALVPVFANDEDAREWELDGKVLDLFHKAALDNPDKRDAILNLIGPGVDRGRASGFVDALRTSAEEVERDPRAWRRENPNLFKIFIEDPEKLVTYADEKVSAPMLKMRKALKMNEERDANVRSTGVGRAFDWYMYMLNPTVALLSKYQAAAITTSVVPDSELPKSVVEAGVAKTDVPTVQSEERGAGAGWDRFMRSVDANFAGLSGNKRIYWERKLNVAENEGDAQGVEEAKQALYSVNAEIKENNRRNNTQVDYGQGAIEQIGLDVAEGLGSQAYFFGTYVTGAATGAAIGFGVGGPAGAAKGASIGGKAATVVGSFALENGSMFNELRDFEDEDGKKIDLAVAVGTSAIYAALASGVEVVSLGPKLQKFGPIGDTLSGVALRNAVKKLAMKEGAKEFFGDLGKRLMKGVAAEGGEEMVQEMLQVMGEWAAKEGSGIDGNFDVEETLVRLGTAGYKGALTSGATSIAAVPVNVVQEVARKRRSIREVEQADALVEIATNQNAKEKSGDLAAIIEAQTEVRGKPLDTIYYDPQKIAQWLEKQENPRQALTQLLGEKGAQRMAAAISKRQNLPGQRNTLEVPVKEFVERFGDIGAAKELFSNMTLSEDAWSAEELVSMPAQMDTIMRDILKAHENDSIDETFISPAEKQYAERLQRQLIESGVMREEEARLVVAKERAFLRTMAAKSPEAAKEIFENTELNVLNEYDISTRAAQSSKLLLKHLQDQYVKKGGKRDVGGVANRLYIDKTTGLFNERAFKRAAAMSKNPLLVRAKIEGVKWVNDNLNHEAGDNLFRFVANSVRELSPDAARWGGDFAWTAESEETAEAQAETLRELLRTRIQEAIRAHQTKLKDSGEDFTTISEEAIEGLQGLDIIVGTKPRESAREDGSPADLNHVWSTLGDELGALAKEREALPEGDPRRKAVRQQVPLGLPVENPAQLGLPEGAAKPVDIPDYLKKEAADKSMKDIFDDLFVDKAAGMYTRDAFFSLPKKKYQIALDLNDLGKVNEALGKDFGNAMLAAFNKAALAAGGAIMDMAHLSGDEYAAQTDDPALAQLWVDILGELTDKIRLEDKDGNPTLKVTFKYGISDTYKKADELTKDFKARSEADAKAGKAPTTHERIARAKRDQSRFASSEGGRGEASGGRGGSLPTGRANLARRVTAASFPSAKRRPRGVSQKAWATIKENAHTKIYQHRLDALRGVTSAEIAKALKDIEKSPLMKALADMSIDDLTPPRMEAAVPVFKSLDDAYNKILDASFANSESPTAAADSKYLASKEVKDSPKPAPDESGKFDAVNQILRAKKSRRVSGVREAFDRLYNSVTGSMLERAEYAVTTLNENVEGLEKLTLPEEYLRERLAEEQRLERQAQEEAYWDAVSEPDVALQDEDLGPEFWEDFDETSFYSKMDPLKNHRGMMRHRRNGAKSAYQIFLNRKSSPSTVIHELAHVHLEMINRIAAHPGASDTIKRDVQAIFDAIGHKGKFGSRIGAQAHETFAYSTERYFFDGHPPPSEKTAHAFYMFRRWMKATYGAAAKLLPIKNEIPRQYVKLFDRLFATDEELARVRAKQGADLVPFRSREEAGMTPKQWRNFLEAMTKTSTNALLSIRRKMVEAEKRAAKAFKTTEFAKLKEELSDEWELRRDVRAMDAIMKGQWRSKADGKRVIVDKEFLRMDSDTVTKYLPKDHPLHRRIRSRMKKGGVHPEALARTIGYTGKSPAYDMFVDLQRMPDRQEWIQEQAEMRMKEKHPEIDGEIADLEEQLQLLQHDDINNAWFLEQLKALMQKKPVKMRDDLAKHADASAKRSAEAIVSDMMIGRLDPNGALRRERAAATQVAVEVAKGDQRRGIDQMLKRLLAFHEWREIKRARDDRDRFHKIVKKIVNPKLRVKLARGGYKEVMFMDGILSSLGFIERSPEAPHTPGKALEGMDFEEGGGPAFDAEVVGGIMDSPKPWRSLTVSEMRDVSRALGQLLFMARAKTELLIEGELQDLEEFVEEARADLESRRTRKERRPVLEGNEFSDEVALAMARTRALGERANSQILNPAEIIRRMGPVLQKLIWGGFKEALFNFGDLQAQSAKWLNDNWVDLPAELRDRSGEIIEDIDGVQTDQKMFPYTRLTMYMIALNMGNESNRLRLLGGYGWNEADVLKWLDRNMEKEEWQYVESIWKHFDKVLWPKVREQHLKTTGMVPEKIPAMPITTRHGITVTGGYFPAKYDPEFSNKGQEQLSEDLDGKYFKNSAAITVANGFTKNRAKKYNDIISLDWHIIPSHVTAVNQYLAFDTYIRNAKAVLLHPKMRATISERVGVGAYNQIVDPKGGFLASIATPHADSVPTSLKEIHTWLGIGRNLLVTHALGWVIKTPLADTVEPAKLVVSGKVKASYVLGAATKIYGSSLGALPRTWGGRGVGGYAKAREFALEHSRELRHRNHNMKLGIREWTSKVKIQLAGRSKAQRRMLKVMMKVADTSFVTFDTMDRLVSTTAWTASYNQAMDQAGDGLTAEQAHKRAVKIADDNVEWLMPVQDQMRKMRLMRSNQTGRNILIFHGFFSQMYNQIQSILDPVVNNIIEADSTYDAIKKRSGKMAIATGVSLGLVAVSQLLAEPLMGNAPVEGEDAEDWMLRRMIAGSLALLPLGTAFSQVTGAGQHEDQTFRSVPGIPLLELLQDVHRGIQKAQKKGDVEAMLEYIHVAGIILGQPFGSLQWKRLVEALEGEGGRALERGNVPVAVENIIWGDQDKKENSPFRTLPRVAEETVDRL